METFTLSVAFFAGVAIGLFLGVLMFVRRR